jgi:hypothetical protein
LRYASCGELDSQFQLARCRQQTCHEGIKERLLRSRREWQGNFKPILPRIREAGARSAAMAESHGCARQVTIMIRRPGSRSRRLSYDTKAELRAARGQRGPHVHLERPRVFQRQVDALVHGLAFNAHRVAGPTLHIELHAMDEGQVLPHPDGANQRRQRALSLRFTRRHQLVLTQAHLVDSDCGRVDRREFHREAAGISAGLMSANGNTVRLQKRQLADIEPPAVVERHLQAGPLAPGLLGRQQ